MNERKSTEKKIVLQRLLEKTRNAIEGGSLSDLAEAAHEDPEHPLKKSLNKFPALPFSITEEDLEEIRPWVKFPSEELLQRDWTPLEKLFFAHLWKDGKLTSSGRIIEGIDRGGEKEGEKVSKAIVYHFFGRHLADRVANPIIDQHSYRAYRLIEQSAGENLHELRDLQKVPSEEEATAYCDWFREILDRENISIYENSRVVDSYLFALGKYAKLTKQDKKESKP